MKNESGIRPMGYQVVVLPDTVESVTDAGIILPDVEKDQFAQEEGTFVEAGSIAFTEPEWKAVPSPGAKVIYKKYSGIQIDRNGKAYRLMEDNCIGAVIEE